MTATIIDINLTLTSPLHVAFPDNQEERNGRKICHTTKKPIVDVGIEASNRATMVPYFPANGLRGGLRRKAAARVMERLCQGESRVTALLYLGLTCGASSGSPDQTALSIEELLRARRNVYMGLFGGGARLIQSAYRVSDINPVIDLTVKTGVVPAACADRVVARPAKEEGGRQSYLAAWELTPNLNNSQSYGLLNLIRVDDVYRVMRDDEIARFVMNPTESVAAHQATVGMNVDERKAGAASKEDVANMMVFETVAAGTPMHFRVTLAPAASEAQAGLLLLSLADLIQENSMGGFGRIDCGRFRVDTINIQLGDNLGGEKVSVADCREGSEFRLPESAVITRLTDAANVGLQELSIEEMQGYFTDFSAGAKEAKKAEKKAKSAAAA